MAGNDIDFEELDRAISALMEENQTVKTSPLNSSATNSTTNQADDEATNDFKSTNLGNDDKIGSTETETEAETILHTAKQSDIPDTSSAKVEIKARQPIGLGSTPEAATVKSPTIQSEPSAEARSVFTVRRFDLPDRSEPVVSDDTSPVKVSFDRQIEQMAETAVTSFSKQPAKSDSKTDQSINQPASVEKNPPVKQATPVAPALTTKSPTEPLNSPKITPPVVETVKVTTVKKPVLPSRRGRYMDFMPSAAKTAPKNLNPAELLAKKRQRAAAINRATAPQSAMSDVKPAKPASAAKPMSHSQSVDFAINLPAESDAPAVEVKGNYQTSHTTTQTEAGDTLTIKRETVNYVATPVNQPETTASKPAAESAKTDHSSFNQNTDSVPKTSSVFEEAKPQVTATPLKSTSTDEQTSKTTSVDSLSKTPEVDDTTRKSPFLAEAKVKKRPLGQPEPLLSSPAVTMKVPERIKAYDADSQTALYRAELHQNLPEEKSSKFWLVLMIIVILIIAGIVYYFWGDLKALFL